MKFVIVIYMFLIIHKGVSPFAVVEYVSGKFDEFVNSLSVTFNNVKNKVNDFILNKILNYQSYSEISSHDSTIYNEECANQQSVKNGPHTAMSMPELATLHGKRVESHVVQSKDGYLLTLHRVLSKESYNHSKENNKTVLLHHGLLGSSADWILLGSEKSLPYLLTQAGYDVWMANARGNYYSRGHISLKVNSVQFWKFTWQEMGEFDLPAIIDYIRKLKKMDDPINFIGHSMGCTALLVLLSILPKYNKFLRIGVLLAPLAFMNNVEGPLKILATVSIKPPVQVLEVMGKGEFLPMRKIPKWIAMKYCQGPIQYCSNPLFFISGGILQFNSRNSTFVEQILYHIPAGTSTDTILHYAQMIKSGKFHRYCDTHSEFPLKEVTLPIALFSSTDDRLATVPDVLKLYFSIGNPVDNYVIRGEDISHIDFVWGAKADAVVFAKVIDILGNNSTWNFMKS